MDSEIFGNPEVDLTVKKPRKPRPSELAAKAAKKKKSKAKKPKAVKPKVKAKVKAKKKKPAKKSKPAAPGARSARLDLRLTRAEKTKIHAKAKKLRRTVTSIVIEAIEKIK